MKDDNQLKTELLLKIHRVLNKDGEWMPAIEDVTSHDIDPVWVAGVAYLLIDRYVSSVKESKQNKFYEEVIGWFEKMSKNNNATQYVERIRFKEIQD